MFRRRSGWPFLLAVIMCCVTFLYAIVLLRDVVLPEWSILEVMRTKLDVHLHDRRIDRLEHAVLESDCELVRE